jgi:hypothetical protein
VGKLLVLDSIASQSRDTGEQEIAVAELFLGFTPLRIMRKCSPNDVPALDIVDDVDVYRFKKKITLSQGQWNIW